MPKQSYLCVHDGGERGAIPKVLLFTRNSKRFWYHNGKPQDGVKCFQVEDYCGTKYKYLFYPKGAPTNKPVFTFPGGELEGRETAIDSALREWKEETGYDLEGEADGHTSLECPGGTVFYVKTTDILSVKDAIEKNFKKRSLVIEYCRKLQSKRQSQWPEYWDSVDLLVREHVRVVLDDELGEVQIMNADDAMEKFRTQGVKSNWLFDAMNNLLSTSAVEKEEKEEEKKEEEKGEV